MQESDPYAAHQPLSTLNDDTHDCFGSMFDAEALRRLSEASRKPIREFSELKAPQFTSAQPRRLLRAAHLGQRGGGGALRAGGVFGIRHKHETEQAQFPGENSRIERKFTLNPIWLDRRIRRLHATRNTIPTV